MNVLIDGSDAKGARSSAAPLRAFLITPRRADPPQYNNGMAGIDHRLEVRLCFVSSPS
jgi:hypothetical protein